MRSTTRSGTRDIAPGPSSPSLAYGITSAE
ncbi:hypothetical protein LINGRAHAP2_LOCUS7041 [Linum grandiflorum]